MRRRWTKHTISGLLVASVACSLMAGHSPADAADTNSPPPNIIIFMTDDQGPADVTSGNHRTPVDAPNFRRLANQGIVFTDAYAPSPMCTPSRVGMLSGIHPARFGVYDVGGDSAYTWPEDQLILSQLLKKEGYTNGIIGKWHSGGNVEKWAHNHPLKREFDRFWGFLGSTQDYFDPRIGSGFNGTGYTSCGYNPIHDQDKVVEEMDYLTDEITRQAVAFIEENRNDPFFLWVSHHAPHVPLQGPRESYERYTHLGLGRNTTIARAMQWHVDTGLGAVLDKIEELGLMDNTLIIYTSDNGGGERSGQLNADFRGGKFTPMEGGIRVPQAISWPAVLPAGRVFTEPVWNLDFAPTIHAAVTGKTLDGVDGVNLLPYLLGEADAPPHEALFWKLPPANGYGVRAGDWKLTRSRIGLGLFNLRDDPGEYHDLSSEHPEIVDRLESTFQEWDEDNQPSFWNDEYRRRFQEPRESPNPLENKDWQYSDTFGGAR